MKVFNKGIVYDQDTGKEYELIGVEYDNGFKGGNGLVLVLSEDESYAAIQEVRTIPSNSSLEIEKIIVTTVAKLKDYKYVNGQYIN